MTDLGHTNKLKHSIHTENAAPTRQPVRHISPHRRDEIRTLLTEMLKKEVVEPSTSPWASPIVLVKKRWIDPLLHGHLSNLESVFRRLREAGLYLKLSKCSLFRYKVQYLGHVISREGIAVDPTKIGKVATWIAPHSKREIQKFLGFASYYRRFIKDFAQIAKPLHWLIEDTATFAWTEPCQTAFEDTPQHAGYCSTGETI